LQRDEQQRRLERQQHDFAVPQNVAGQQRRQPRAGGGGQRGGLFGGINLRDLTAHAPTSVADPLACAANTDGLSVAMSGRLR
jgi:hypothetical protein